MAGKWEKRTQEQKSVTWLVVPYVLSVLSDSHLGLVNYSMMVLKLNCYKLLQIPQAVYDIKTIYIASECLEKLQFLNGDPVGDDNLSYTYTIGNFFDCFFFAYIKCLM